MLNSHVVLPKSTLLQFANTNSGSLCYLDVHKNQIYKAFARKFNTFPDYYPDWSEKYLSQIETLMGRIRKNVPMLIEGKNKHAQIDKHDVIRCMTTQLLRNPNFVKKTRDKSTLGSQAQLPPILYSSLHFLGEECIDEAVEIMEQQYADYEINICLIDNSCDFSFILPTSHCLNGPGITFFVLSPHQAIILLPANENKKYHNEDGSLNYPMIKNYSVLEALYKKAVKDERENNPGWIVGLRNQLEVLQNYI